MKMLPFPPELARQSAHNARKALEASKGRGIRDHVTPGVGAYRTPDGKVRPVYDFYRPAYPEGATPGLGDMQHRLEHYLNDTSGYRTSVLDFTPADDLLAGRPRWANPAVAVEPAGPFPRFILAHDEAELARILEAENEEDETDWRRTITHVHAADLDQPPNAVLAVFAPGSQDIHVADDPERLIEVAQEWPGMAKHLPATGEPLGRLFRLARELNAKDGWAVAFGAGMDLDIAFEPAEDGPDPA
jgi:hypothetical protein